MSVFCKVPKCLGGKMSECQNVAVPKCCVAKMTVADLSTAKMSSAILSVNRAGLHLSHPGAHRGSETSQCH